jgi:PAS domain S-box-containing protein
MPDPILTERIFETSLDLILVTDKFGKFVRVSPSAREILGYDPKEMTGHIASDFLYPADLNPTRDQMRLVRGTGKSSTFDCRYVHKNGNIVSLVWKGVWVEEIEQYFFIGRQQSKGWFLSLSDLDATDGFQISKGLFALSLFIAYYFSIGSSATLEIRHVLEVVNGQAPYWAAFMLIYSLTCFLCIFWKSRWFQFMVSVISVVIWIWMGSVTLLSPKYIAAAGIYELMLGVGSVVLLYFHGRRF